MFKRCRDYIKPVITLAKIQSAREAYRYLALLDNCKTFYSHIFVVVKGYLGLLLWPHSKVQGECTISYFYCTLNSMRGGIASKPMGERRHEYYMRMLNLI